MAKKSILAEAALFGLLLSLAPAQAADVAQVCVPEPTEMTLAYGDLVTCEIGNAGDSDTFRFQGAPGEALTIVVGRRSGVGLPCVELFDPAGTPVGDRACSPFGARLDPLLSRAGTYAIRVSEYFSKSTFEYALSLVRMAPSPSGKETHFSQSMAGEITPAGDVDVYFFSGSAGSAITVVAGRAGGSGLPCIEVFDSSGRSVGARACSPFGARIDTRLQATGVYAVRVSEYFSNNTFRYVLDLQCVGACVPPSGSLSEAAYALLSDRVAANRSAFYLYQDGDAGLNHGFPSGFFGTVSRLHIDAFCVDDPESTTGCTTDRNRLDRTRGTVLRITFDPLAPGEFAGLNIEEPENFGGTQAGNGFDLRGATDLVFDYRSPTPGGIRVQFGVADRTTAFTVVPQSQTYSTMRISLGTLGLDPTSLANVHVLFTVVTNDQNAPNGGTLLVDNIRLEPVPLLQQSALGFPLANQTFGVVPTETRLPGRMPVPPDQVLRNGATIYESALVLDALLARGTAQDLLGARLLADTFVYALASDNAGDPLPPAANGATGLHNAYSSGDLALHNDQSVAKEGEVRLAGFTAGAGLCGPTGFCVVLDGATGGNNAFAVLALIGAYRKFSDVRYLDAARKIGNWIYSNLADESNAGYGGYYLGYPDEGVVPKTLLRGKSIENNADIFAACMALSGVDSDQAAEWVRRANIAGDFVMEMYDGDSDRFFAGTVPVGQPPIDGIQPIGPTRGTDVINTYDFLDSNTFTTLAMAASPRYHERIDWRKPMQWVLGHQAKVVTAGGLRYEGFNLTEHPAAGPEGVAWEFTAQAVMTMRFLDDLYGQTAFSSRVEQYLAQLRQAQARAPFGDGRGLVASTLQDGDLLPPAEQCKTTPFQCIAERVGLAATAWAIFAGRGHNPLAW